MPTEMIMLLQTCAAIERECAGLYHWLSDLFKEDRKAALLWKKTALEEENHESQFHLAEKLAEGMMAVPLLDVTQADTELERVRQLRQELKKNPPGLVRALELAIAIEEELADFHLDTVLLYGHEDHRKMFAAMMAHDREHASSLRGFLDEVTDAGSRG